MLWFLYHQKSFKKDDNLKDILKIIKIGMTNKTCLSNEKRINY